MRLPSGMANLSLTLNGESENEFIVCCKKKICWCGLQLGTKSSSIQFSKAFGRVWKLKSSVLPRSQTESWNHHHFVIWQESSSKVQNIAN